MKASERASTVLMWAAVLSAVTSTALLVERRFSTSRGSQADPWAQPLKLVDGWETLVDSGLRIGPANARIQVVEFGDFECPACKSFGGKVLDPLLRRYPAQIALTFKHWPLEYHRFARRAAIAAECSGKEGRFPSFYEAAYAHQDSIGLISFADIARRAGLIDTVAFNECLASDRFDKTLQRDLALVDRLDARGTPVIIVNGLLLPTTPTSERFERLLDSLGLRRQ